MSATLLPDAMLVSAAWLRQSLGLDHTRIGQSLPKRALANGADAPWVANGGFLMLTPIGGPGSADELEILQDVVQVDAYACVSKSNKPPMGVASQLAQQAYAATKARAGAGVFVLTGTNYVRAQVHSVNPMTRPRPIKEVDGTGLARFQFDIMVNWCTIP